MPTKKYDHAEEKLCGAALKLIGSRGWGTLTLDQIGKASQIPSSQIKKAFADKNQLLPALIKFIDHKVAATFGKKLPEGSPHDRLFEVMMARFDNLQNHRKAFLNIAIEVKRDPSLARHLFLAHTDAMQKMLQLASIKSDGVKNILATLGLSAVYALTLHAWTRDDTSDMSRTMAALDKHLRRAGKLAEILFRAI